MQSAHHRAIDAARLAAQIADFGLSRSISNSRSRRTTSSGGAGTDCWMPPEGLAGKCGDLASLTFSYDVHPTGSLLYCAGPWGAAERLWRFESQIFFLQGFQAGPVRALSEPFWRMSARAVLLSGGIHAFPGASDLEQNNNIVKGRWRRTGADGICLPAFACSASNRGSPLGEEGSRESGLTALVSGGVGSSTRATTAPWPPARWRRPRPSPSSPRCYRVGLAVGCAAI